MWYKDLLQELGQFCAQFGVKFTGQPNSVSVTKSQTDHEKVFFDPKTGNLRINLHHMSAPEKQRFLDFVGKAHSLNVTFVEIKAQSRLEIIEESETQASKSEVFKALKDVLGSKDLLALRLALYMKIQHDKGESRRVQVLKQQICEKFGDRGKNISNLCTAGYFESFILPVLEECKKNPNVGLEGFKKYFEVMVDESAFSIFVNRGMSKADIMERVKQQIARNRRYGVEDLVVHGIGSVNVRNIASALRELEIRGDLHISTLDKSKKNIIRVRCSFEDENS